MSPRSLFNIILKVLGLFFLREIINAFPSLVFSFLFLTGEEGNLYDGIVHFVMSAIIVGFYIGIVHILFFKTNYLLDRFKLAEGFEEDKFSFNISSSSVLTIALIVIGGLLLAVEIPNLCSLLYSNFQEEQLTSGTIKPDFSDAIVSGVKIAIELLIIGERKWIVGLIDPPKKENEVE